MISVTLALVAHFGKTRENPRIIVRRIRKIVRLKNLFIRRTIFLKSDFFLRLVIKELLKVDVRTFLLHFFAKNREDGGRVISFEICHILSQIRGAFLEKNRP